MRASEKKKCGSLLDILYKRLEGFFMNKVFKIVWNEARNAYVVVSEIAKNRCKSCSTRKLLAVLMATGVMICGGGD